MLDLFWYLYEGELIQQLLIGKKTLGKKFNFKDKVGWLLSQWNHRPLVIVILSGTYRSKLSGKARLEQNPKPATQICQLALQNQTRAATESDICPQRWVQSMCTQEKFPITQKAYYIEALQLSTMHQKFYGNNLYVEL